MLRLILLSFAVVFFLEFIVGAIGVGRIGNLFLDGFMIFLMLVIILVMAKDKIFKLSGKYNVLFILMFLHVVGSILINAVPPGAIVVGMRVYFKYIPFLFIPIILNFTDSQIKYQLKYLLVLALMQMPIVVYQRFVSYKGVLSGDRIVGSLSISSYLSIFLVCVIAILTAAYVKNMVTIKQFLILLFLLFFPMMLNETKGTIFLLPFALLIPIIFGGMTRENIKKMCAMMSIIIIFFISFVGAYDYFYSERYNRSLLDVIVNIDYLKAYLAPESTGMQEDRIGKLDKVIKPFEVLSDSKLNILVGLGMGNVTKAPIDEIAGNYTEYIDEDFVGGTMSYVLWEFGVIGAILLLVFILMIFVDSYRLRKQDNIYGMLGLGMMAVCFIIIESLFYKNIIYSGAIASVFLFIAGLIIAKQYDNNILKS